MRRLFENNLLSCLTRLQKRVQDLQNEQLNSENTSQEELEVKNKEIHTLDSRIIAIHSLFGLILWIFFIATALRESIVEGMLISFLVFVALLVVPTVLPKKAFSALVCRTSPEKGGGKGLAAPAPKRG